MKQTDLNRKLIAVHLHRERDAELLEWLDRYVEQEKQNDPDASNSGVLRTALYDYAQRNEGPADRHDEVRDQLEHLTGLMYQVLQKLAQGIPPQQIHNETAAALDDRMKSGLRNTAVRPGRGRLPVDGE